MILSSIGTSIITARHFFLVITRLGGEFSAPKSKRPGIDLAWPSQPLETRSYLHTIAMNVAHLDNHLTDVDADPEHISAIFGKSVIAPRHRCLNGERVVYRVHDAADSTRIPLPSF